MGVLGIVLPHLEFKQWNSRSSGALQEFWDLFFLLGGEVHEFCEGSEMFSFAMGVV